MRSFYDPRTGQTVLIAGNVSLRPGETLVAQDTVNHLQGQLATLSEAQREELAEARTGVKEAWDNPNKLIDLIDGTWSSVSPSGVKIEGYIDKISALIKASPVY